LWDCVPLSDFSQLKATFSTGALCTRRRGHVFMAGDE
jgi:hypothetical protein